MKNKMMVGKILFLQMFLLFVLSGDAQTSKTTESTDPLSYGVVMDDPAMAGVVIKEDIPYLKDDQGDLKLDIYSPPQLSAAEKRPVIVFLNAIGDRPGQRKVKSWGIYSSWPKLVAAYGFIGISMEANAIRIQESINGLFNFIKANEQEYHIDADKMGVYAASANVSQSMIYLMSEKANPGIKAAVLYYGGTPTGPFRRDLPVFFVVSEGDVVRNGYTGLWSEVLKNNAPWTIRMGTDMPHAFDAYSDNDEARKIIKETISFWKNQLDPVSPPGFPHSKMRDVFGLLRMNRPKAIEILKSITSEYPDNMAIQMIYADALRESGNKEGAVPVYKLVLLEEPDNINAKVSLGLIYLSTGKTEESQKLIDEADHSGKMTAESYGSLGLALLTSGRNQEAVKYYEKALSIRPNGINYYNLACAYAKSGQPDRAFEALSNAMQSGAVTKQLIENDTDLISLRVDNRYKQILEKVQ